MTRRIHLPEGVSEGGVAYGARSLWLASGPGVVRVDPGDGHIEHRFRLPGISGSMRLVFANGFLWAARPGNGVVAKIDPAGNRILKTTLHGWVSDLAVGGGRIWVSIVPDDKVYELSPDDLSVQSVAALGRDPERISVGGGQLWSANPAATSITRLDGVSQKRDTLTAAAEPATAALPRGARLGRRRVGAAAAAARLGPGAADRRLRNRPSTPWPASLNEQALYATCANLLNYPDSSGRRGRAPPARDRGGDAGRLERRPHVHVPRTPRLSLLAAVERAGHGRDVPAHDRAGARDAQGDTYASDIVGAAAFRGGKAPHVAGITARGDRLSITLVRCRQATS